MTKRLVGLGIAGVIAFVCGIGVAQDRRQHSSNGPTLVHPYEAAFKEVAPGVSEALLWGDPHKQSYGAWTQFEPHADAGVHTYTNDIWMVVIHGAYVYDDGAEIKRVGPGDFLRIPGGTKYRGSSDGNWGALVYEESSPRAGTSGANDVQGRQQRPNGAATYVPLDGVAFTKVAAGVSKVVLWGDQDKGPYGAYIKFDPEFDAGPQRHASDVWIVVLEGFYLYQDAAGEKRLGAGDFIRIPAGTAHRSAGDKKWGAVFYEASTGRLDLEQSATTRTQVIRR